MNLLILQPTLKKLQYSLFSWDENKTVLNAEAENFPGITSEKNEWIETLTQITQHCQQAMPEYKIDAIVITAIFGGATFTRPAIVDHETIRQLEYLIPQAPLHLPGTIQLINCCSEVLQAIPTILVFETSFFSTIPERESEYAISSKVRKELNLKRHGCNGIYHEAAYLMASRQLRKNSKTAFARIISICLEPQPEVAAIKDRRVMMMTKAIPGETMCGQIDPSIVLTLSETVGWGPEKINSVLTRQSGLLGLTGKNITLKDIFTQDYPDLLLAKQICQYRLLNACAMAAAAMGNIDAIVFSGRFVKLADILGPFLIKKLTQTLTPKAELIGFYLLEESKTVSIANIATGTNDLLSKIAPFKMVGVEG